MPYPFASSCAETDARTNSASAFWVVPASAYTPDTASNSNAAAISAFV